MTGVNIYKDVQHVIHLSTNVGKGCEHCTGVLSFSDDLDDRINHYIEVHGYKLLHVGTETIDDSNGGPWHTTVAVVGK